VSGDFVIVEAPLDVAGLHALMRAGTSWQAELDPTAEAWFSLTRHTRIHLDLLHRVAGLASDRPGDPMRADLEGPTIPAIRGEIRKLERQVWELLETPEHPAFEDAQEAAREVYACGVPSCLEVAEYLIGEARRLLTLAIRSTRNLRERMALALALFRVGALCAQIDAHRSPAPSRTPSSRERTGTVADVLRSLTQAAHAPPRVAAYPLSCVLAAGGGPL
jgi:hypothetical protein